MFYSCDFYEFILKLSTFPNSEIESHKCEFWKWRIKYPNEALFWHKLLTIDSEKFGYIRVSQVWFSATCRHERLGDRGSTPPHHRIKMPKYVSNWSWIRQNIFSIFAFSPRILSNIGAVLGYNYLFLFLSGVKNGSPCDLTYRYKQTVSHD